MSIVNHVFVYGTLLRGMSAANLLDELGAQFVDNARVRGRLYISDFPRLLAASGDDEVVQGELYAFPNIDVALITLDRFEREGELYTRRLSNVSIQSDQTMLAWLYLSRTTLPERYRVPSGSYREYLGRTSSG